MDGLLFLINYKEDNDRIKVSERVHFINLLSQKFLVHCFSIRKLVEGITLESKTDNLKVPISDPFSIQTLVRTAIENYLVINYLSNSSIDKDLLDGRFDIWMRYGLKQRRVTPFTEEEKRVTDLDEKSIQKLEESIKERDFFKELSADKKVKFLSTINGEWKIIFDREKFYPVSWKRLLDEAGINKDITAQIYNLLSWHAHSQSISILQLKDMWNSKFDKTVIRIAMNKLNMFIGFTSSDLIRSSDLYKGAYNKLDQDLKDIINFYNYCYRSKDHAIEGLKNEA